MAFWKRPPFIPRRRRPVITAAPAGWAVAFNIGAGDRNANVAFNIGAGDRNANVEAML